MLLNPDSWTDYAPGRNRRVEQGSSLRALALPARITLAGVLLTLSALFASPASAQDQTTIWSATLTVGRPASGSDALGYCQGAANCPAAAAHYGSLSEPGFSIGETEYTVTSIRWGVGGEGHVHLTLDRPLSAEDVATLVLHLDDAGLGLAEASVNEPSDHGFTANYTWDGDGSAPDEASTVSVSLTSGPAGPAPPR